MGTGSACEDCDDNDPTRSSGERDLRRRDRQRLRRCGGSGRGPGLGRWSRLRARGLRRERQCDLHGCFDEWGDGIDLDCDGADGNDLDGDGYPGDALDATLDCDDKTRRSTRRTRTGTVRTAMATATTRTPTSMPPSRCGGIDSNCALTPSKPKRPTPTGTTYPAVYTGVDPASSAAATATTRMPGSTPPMRTATRRRSAMATATTTTRTARPSLSMGSATAWTLTDDRRGRERRRRRRGLRLRGGLRRHGPEHHGVDADGDGRFDCGLDGLASTGDEDCDDLDASIFPGRRSLRWDRQRLHPRRGGAGPG